MEEYSSYGQDFDEGYVQMEMKRIFLETFTMDRGNKFDDLAEKANSGLMGTIGPINRQIKEIEEKINAFHRLNDEVSENEKRELEAEQGQLLMYVYYYNEELIALQQVRVIYAFKHLEINLKILLKACYPDAITADFYKWHKLERFIKQKKIPLDSLAGYKEVIELKEVNNNFKHSGDINDKKIQPIKEFKGKKCFYYDDLHAFYERVRPYVDSFLQALADTILTQD